MPSNDFQLTVRKCLVEFIGTTILVFMGSLSFTFPLTSGTIGPAFAHGLTIAILIISMGHISGGHYNPAVTLGVVISGKMHPVLALFYWLSQIIGAIFGALLVFVSLNPATYCTTAGGTVNPSLEHVYSSNALIAESVLTFFLVQTVLSAAIDSEGDKILSGLVIGLAIVVGICAGGDKSGASMNPARSFGPAVVYSIVWNHLNETIATTNFSLVPAHQPPAPCLSVFVVWEYYYLQVFGPAIGAIVAAGIYKFVLADDESRIFLKNNGGNYNVSNAN